MKVAATTKPSLSFRKKWMSLKWLDSPSRWLPHGAAGLVSVVIGLRVLVLGLLGQLDHHFSPKENDGNMGKFPFTFCAYALATTLNASAGYRLAKRAPKQFQGIFRRCAIFQVCLCYYVVRFARHTTLAYNSIILLPDDEDVTIGSVAPLLVRTADILAAAASLLCMLSFLHIACTLWSQSKAITIGIIVGLLCLCTVILYPVQLAVHGQQWHEEVQQRYPHQALAIVSYIYVPCTLVFSLMLFNATLWLRGVVHVNGWGMILALSAPCALVATALAMEAYFYDTSTQRLYIPRNQDDYSPESWQGKIDHVLDFSRYCRQLLVYAFGMRFPETCTTPEYHALRPQ